MNIKLTDNEILDLINRNKDQGFRVLMVQHQEKIYWHVRKMVTFHEDADDVVQNTFIKVYKNIDKFKGDSKLYTWIYRIATNESLTFLRKKKNNREDAIDGDNSSFAAALKADKYFDGTEAEHLLQQAMQILPEKQKLVFSLRYYDNMSYAEMSESLETSVGGLKASYHHAVKKIEDFIKSEG